MFNASGFMSTLAVALVPLSGPFDRCVSKKGLEPSRNCGIPCWFPFRPHPYDESTSLCEPGQTCNLSQAEDVPRQLGWHAAGHWGAETGLQVCGFFVFKAEALWWTSFLFFYMGDLWSSTIF